MGKGRYKGAPLPARPDPRFRVTRMAFGPGFSFSPASSSGPKERKKQAFCPMGLQPNNSPCFHWSVRSSWRASWHPACACALRTCAACRSLEDLSLHLYGRNSLSGPGRGAQASASTPRRSLSRSLPSDNLSLLLLIKMKLFPGIQMIWSARPSAGPGLVYDCIIA